MRGASIWDHELWDRGHAWWRGVFQGGGAFLCYVFAEVREVDRHLILMLIGAVYGSLIAGVAFHLREVKQDGGENAWPLFLAHLGAAAGFTYFFFLSGVHCEAGRLIVSPLFAGVGGVIGAALGMAARRFTAR